MLAADASGSIKLWVAEVDGSYSQAARNKIVLDFTLTDTPEVSDANYPLANAIAEVKAALQKTMTTKPVMELKSFVYEFSVLTTKEASGGIKILFFKIGGSAKKENMHKVTISMKAVQ